ncbi:MAG TPA: hypothetical protein VFM05_02960, partial [Candidatus Saccharimonadales bacterium]|nr:hypothetical protein [Candidatus Saccharimonadales bacterium]
MTRHLDLGANGVFTFNNPQELNQWITANIEAWAFVSATQVAAYKVAVRSLQSILPQIPSDFTDDATWSVFADAIAKVYSRAIRHESPRGAFVIGLKAEGDPVAAGALAIFVKVALHNPIEVQALRGAILGAAYEAANLQALGQAPKVLDSLTHDFRVWWEQSKLEINSEKSLISESRTTIADFQKVTIGQLGALKSETDASLTKLTDTHRTATQDLSNLVNSQVSEFTSKLRELTQSHSEKMAAIERTYEEKLALHEAASYWRKKLAYHKKMSMT